jgi:MoaA/NifB/PqqE/SkfB family radical SAM enzyme
MALPARDTWRPHPLDGALLWFHPPTGTHLRWDGPPTRHLRRTAPRVVMFGITNRCNLTCGFCSRDLEAGSRWDAENAFEMLAGLARRGVLEVAFGGGEPLVFRGFDDLVDRLAAETPLAVHFTTNGSLLTPERLARLRGKVGEIRISLYDDNPWPERVALLADSGIQFGANLLVTPERLPELPSLLARLAQLGCTDVALLSYVGDDRRLRLGAGDDARLATIVADSAIRARVSVCFGDRLDPVPRLFDGTDGDCGAGVDFLVLTSDCQVKACSFQDHGRPVATADDVLAIWRERRDSLLAPSARGGCARSHARPRHQPLPDGVRVWRGYSSNNSGDCVMVGRFETPEDAQRYLADLLPGFKPGEPFPGEWQELLSAQDIAIDDHQVSPEAMAAVGPAVMLHTYMAVADDFPGLRTLLWKRGGRSVFTGIHVHEDVKLAAGLAFRDAAALDAAEVALAVDEVGDFRRRGPALFGLVGINGEEGLLGVVSRLETVAGQHGATLAAELTAVDKEVNLAQVLAAPLPEEEPQWLWVQFSSDDEAATVASRVQGQVTVAGSRLLVGGTRISPRLGWFVQSQGGSAELLTGARLRLCARLWRPNNQSPALDEVVARLRPRLSPGEVVSTSESWEGNSLLVETAAPGPVLAALIATARELSATPWIEVEPVPDRLVHALARVAKDLRRP